MQKLKWESWAGRQNLHSKEYTCGYCGISVGTHAGYTHNQNLACKIYICPNCGLPTYFNDSMQMPEAPLGREINGLPEDIEAVYKEMRETAKCACYTATLLLGRKLIMHIAVMHGAPIGKTFKEYVDYLSNNHFIPPNATKLLEYMRNIGNEKNHEIKLGAKDEVQKVIKFVESLLYFVYELENEYTQKSN